MNPEQEMIEFYADEYEAEAEKAATERPMVLVTTAAGTTEEVASKLGKRVIARAVEAGMSDTAVQAMRARMLKWLELVKKYEKDRFDVHNDDSLTAQAKASLIKSMHVQQDKARVDIFGE